MAEYLLNIRLLEKWKNNISWMQNIIKSPAYSYDLSNSITSCRVIRTLIVVKIWIEWPLCCILGTFSLYVIYSENEIFANGEYRKI